MVAHILGERTASPRHIGLLFDRRVDGAIGVGTANGLQLGLVYQPCSSGNCGAIGVALRAHDEPQALDPFAGLYDYVQIMGIDQEGSQGQPADPHHKDVGLLRALRAAHPELVLQVDGAVAARAQELAVAGANRLVVGSALVRAEDPRAVYKQLYTLVNGS